ncbi:aldo/keto reductase [Aurantimonas sp. A2-1-M11]|uniref:aldo/keto reductase n=1 Tax=Aurantimonas sp. A2-1-M11 TaxID=3113712 RepID=UPI002F93B313
MSRNELLPIAVKGVGTMVWSPLAAGLLSGAFRPDSRPADSREAAGWSEPAIRDEERLWRIVDCLVDIAKSHDITPAQVALAWTLSRPAISALVVAGLGEAQFRQNIAVAELTLSPDELQRLHQVSRSAYTPLLAPAQFRRGPLLRRRPCPPRQLSRSRNGVRAGKLTISNSACREDGISAA